jgi:hypothetical protein
LLELRGVLWCGVAHESSVGTPTRHRGM